MKPLRAGRYGNRAGAAQGFQPCEYEENASPSIPAHRRVCQQCVQTLKIFDFCWILIGRGERI